MVVVTGARTKYQWKRKKKGTDLGGVEKVS